MHEHPKNIKKHVHKAHSHDVGMARTWNITIVKATKCCFDDGYERSSEKKQLYLARDKLVTFTYSSLEKKLYKSPARAGTMTHKDLQYGTKKINALFYPWRTINVALPKVANEVPPGPTGNAQITKLHLT